MRRPHVIEQKSVIVQDGTDEAKRIAAAIEAWKPIIAYLGKTVGTVWERVEPPLILRLRRYAQDGFTEEDVKAACRQLTRVDVQARCQWPEDWLKEFSTAIENAQRHRQAAETQTRIQRQAAGPSAEERAAVKEMFRAKMREMGIKPLLIGEQR